MCRILMLVESDLRTGPRLVASRVADSAAAAGAEVRRRDLAEAGPCDVAWADALALGIAARGGPRPHETKRWLDSLGFAGWRALREMPGCVFAADLAAGPVATAACRTAARVLGARGMRVFLPTELDAGDPDEEAAWSALGRVLATRLAPRRPPAVAVPAPARASGTHQSPLGAWRVRTIGPGAVSPPPVKALGERIPAAHADRLFELRRHPADDASGTQ